MKSPAQTQKTDTRLSIDDLLVGEKRMNEMTAHATALLLKIARDSKYLDSLVKKIENVERIDGNSQLAYVRLIGVFATQLSDVANNDPAFQKLLEEQRQKPRDLAAILRQAMGGIDENYEG